MNELKSRHLFDISFELHATTALGKTPLGERRIIPIAGGTFEGERLRGKLLPLAGSDLLLTRADGSHQQDVRIGLQTDDGAVILMTYRGVRYAPPDVAARMAAGEIVDRTLYYLRVTPFFETAAPRYDWLNRIVSIGVGERTPTGASYTIYEIL